MKDDVSVHLIALQLPKIFSCVRVLEQALLVCDLYQLCLAFQRVQGAAGDLWSDSHEPLSSTERYMSSLSLGLALAAVLEMTYWLREWKCQTQYIGPFSVSAAEGIVEELAKAGSHAWSLHELPGAVWQLRVPVAHVVDIQQRFAPPFLSSLHLAAQGAPTRALTPRTLLHSKTYSNEDFVCFAAVLGLKLFVYLAYYSGTQRVNELNTGRAGAAVQAARIHFTPLPEGQQRVQEVAGEGEEPPQPSAKDNYTPKLGGFLQATSQERLFVAAEPPGRKSSLALRLACGPGGTEASKSAKRQRPPLRRSARLGKGISQDCAPQSSDTDSHRPTGEDED
jgi:hypothetical protein